MIEPRDKIFYYTKYLSENPENRTDNQEYLQLSFNENFAKNFTVNYNCKLYYPVLFYKENFFRNFYQKEGNRRSLLSFQMFYKFSKRYFVNEKSSFTGIN